MKFKISRSEWEKIGKTTGWLTSIAYAVAEPAKMCDRCGVKPAGEVRDEQGKLLGYSDYCSECDERIDNGPFSRLIKDVGPEKAKEILTDLIQNKPPPTQSTHDEDEDLDENDPSDYRNHLPF